MFMFMFMFMFYENKHIVFREYNKPMVFHKDSALITEFEQKKCY